MSALAATPLKIYLVAGEESGDQLGAKLMRALKQRLAPRTVVFEGVGGRAMRDEGLTSLFPLADIAVMGFSEVVGRLPTIIRRIFQTVSAIDAARPDALVIIDCPGFNLPVAKRVGRRRPDLPIVNYVSPTVWAWRPGRAKRMRAYVDEVLALKPFEPEAHRRLGGPPCTYVGHPLIERLAELRGPEPRESPAGGTPVRLVVLPGSRRSEIDRLMPPFGKALGLLAEGAGAPIEITLPAVDHLAGEIEALASSWPVIPRIVRGEAAKLEAFRQAHAALAASGTVTLELALAGVPMVVAYRVSKIEERLRFLVKVPSFVLPNLILGENVIPEFIQENCTPEKLAAGLDRLVRDTPERRAQTAAFARLDEVMTIGEETPSELAARIVCETIATKQARAA